jgi:hypothetical protein
MQRGNVAPQSSSVKRRAPLTADDDYEEIQLPALSPPGLPRAEQIKEYYMEWILYAAELRRIGEDARVYYYEVEIPRRERVAAGIPTPESDCALEERALLADEWIASCDKDDDWSPAILCAGCDSSDTEWLRLRGTCITACKRCVARLQHEDVPIVITAQNSRGAVKKTPVFPPARAPQRGRDG